MGQDWNSIVTLTHVLIQRTYVALPLIRGSGHKNSPSTIRHTVSATGSIENSPYSKLN